jgi:hypothetical protein
MEFAHRAPLSTTWVIKDSIPVGLIFNHPMISCIGAAHLLCQVRFKKFVRSGGVASPEEIHNVAPQSCKSELLSASSPKKLKNWHDRTVETIQITGWRFVEKEIVLCTFGELWS